MSRTLGIDFSGARDAGRKIWIAEGRSVGSGTFNLEHLFPAVELPASGNSPQAAIPALARYISEQGSARIGCDFPFGLPRPLVNASTWTDFVIQYPDRFANADAFRHQLRHHTQKREFKRQTDLIARTPFNSYNLRLYRQTWWGIAGVLRPLVQEAAIVVRPQQRDRAGRPQLLEVCAACTLKSIDLYPPYKGRKPELSRARRRILDELIARRHLSPPGKALRRLLVENTGGDALDAVIGAIAAMKADLNATPDEYQRLEGRVYFEL